MLQVSVMVMLPSLLADGHGFTGPQSALVIVTAMAANLIGAMVIVATRVRKIPAIALPISAVSAAVFGFITVSGLAGELPMLLACVMAFAATIGTANALIWSLLPAAVPTPEAGGATAGLITQGSFVGVLIGPPTFFWIRHESPLLVAALALTLAVLMLIPLLAHAHAGRSATGTAPRAVDLH
jgi:MFS family permease